MLERSRSFSKGGANIERVMEINRYSIDPTELKRMLRPRFKQASEPKELHLPV
jgi:hypothetical protein